MHKCVMCCENIAASGARAKLRQCRLLRFLASLEGVLQFVSCSSEDERSGNLSIEPAGAVVFNQKVKVIALLNYASLFVSVKMQG